MLKPQNKHNLLPISWDFYLETIWPYLSFTNSVNYSISLAENNKLMIFWYPTNPWHEYLRHYTMKVKCTYCKHLNDLPEPSTCTSSLFIYDRDDMSLNRWHSNASLHFSSFMALSLNSIFSYIFSNVDWLIPIYH